MAADGDAGDCVPHAVATMAAEMRNDPTCALTIPSELCNVHAVSYDTQSQTSTELIPAGRMRNRDAEESRDRKEISACPIRRRAV